MNSANIQMLESAATALAELPDEAVFVGGVTVELCPELLADID